MASPSPSSNREDDEVDKLIETLPKACFMDTRELCKWEGFWFSQEVVKPTITFRSSFQARNDDVFLASSMKTGTVWLKSLVLLILQNHQFHNKDDVLATENPHFLVPTIEIMVYSTRPPLFDPYDSSIPHLLHTHLPYALLPDSVKNSNCKIVYIARNPKDTVISLWHFYNSLLRANQDPFPLEKTFDCFCLGIHPFGPFFEHLVGYWEESRKRPDKVLFIKYEDLKSEPEKYVTRIAEFLTRPLGDEGGGGAAEIVERCSLGRLKNLEVNKSGSIFLNAPNAKFFRKGEVGDWKNYLTPEMEIRINQTSRVKLEPFGLFSNF